MFTELSLLFPDKDPETTVNDGVLAPNEESFPPPRTFPPPPTSAHTHTHTRPWDRRKDIDAV